MSSNYNTESYNHCCSGVEATQIFGGQVFIYFPLDKVVGVVGTSNDHLKQTEVQPKANRHFSVYVQKLNIYSQ